FGCHPSFITPAYFLTHHLIMNEHTLKGEWNQMKGAVKQKWASLTDDDLTHIEGSRDKLVGRVQERYGHNKEEAEREVDDWRHEHKY
ncbi:CsbD family protein, partial [Psychrobacter sp.]|uniref:CsbD family protein n=1 Tax=Psychrobacter sp. TaxID=56811 RepID=UPI003F9E5976